MIHVAYRFTQGSNFKRAAIDPVVHLILTKTASGEVSARLEREKLLTRNQVVCDVLITQGGQISLKWCGETFRINEDTMEKHIERLRKSPGNSMRIEQEELFREPAFKVDSRPQGKGQELITVTVIDSHGRHTSTTGPAVASVEFQRVSSSIPSGARARQLSKSVRSWMGATVVYSSGDRKRITCDEALGDKALQFELAGDKFTIDRDCLPWLIPEGSEYCKLTWRDLLDKMIHKTTAVGCSWMGPYSPLRPEDLPIGAVHAKPFKERLDPTTTEDSQPSSKFEIHLSSPDQEAVLNVDNISMIEFGRDKRGSRFISVGYEREGLVSASLLYEVPDSWVCVIELNPRGETILHDRIDWSDWDRFMKDPNCPEFDGKSFMITLEELRHLKAKEAPEEQEMSEKPEQPRTKIILWPKEPTGHTTPTTLWAKEISGHRFDPNSNILHLDYVDMDHRKCCLAGIYLPSVSVEVVHPDKRTTHLTLEGSQFRSTTTSMGH